MDIALGNITRGTTKFGPDPRNYRLNTDLEEQEKIYKTTLNPLREVLLDVLTKQNDFKRQYNREDLFTIMTKNLQTKPHHDKMDCKQQNIYSTSIWLHNENFNQKYNFVLIQDHGHWNTTKIIIPLTHGTMITWCGSKTKHYTDLVPSNTHYQVMTVLYTPSSRQHQIQ